MIGGRRLIPGRKPADRRVRVDRPHSPYFRYTGQRTSSPRRRRRCRERRSGRALARVRALLFGRPLSIYEELSERLNVFTGLSIFASDNISSSAYATEEIMRVLVLAGAGALVADAADHGRHRHRPRHRRHQLPPDDRAPTRTAAARTSWPATTWARCRA